jgi:hypothetical protein
VRESEISFGSGPAHRVTNTTQESRIESSTVMAPVHPILLYLTIRDLASFQHRHRQTVWKDALSPPRFHPRRSLFDRVKLENIWTSSELRTCFRWSTVVMQKTLAFRHAESINSIMESQSGSWLLRARRPQRRRCRKSRVERVRSTKSG